MQHDTPTSVLRNGFTLIELSIVLVIIALVAGGILLGATLIQSMELKSVMSQLQEYKTAIMTFRNKYNALPGDMAEATQLWGEAAAGSSCFAVQSVGTETCDGNGDGIIGYTGGYTANEAMRTWQHLANAKLIHGRYTGTGSGGVGRRAVIGENVPGSKMPGGGFSFYYLNYPGGSGTHYPVQDTVIFFGKESANWETYTHIFTPRQQWTLDKKMDDGKPGTGKVHTFYYTQGYCAIIEADPLLSEYNVSADDIRCRVVYLLN